MLKVRLPRPSFVVAPGLVARTQVAIDRRVPPPAVVGPTEGPTISSSTPSFADLGVPTALVQHLERSGIDTPFAIQAAVLPDALAGRDVSGRAPTGPGK